MVSSSPSSRKLDLQLDGWTHDFSEGLVIEQLGRRGPQNGSAHVTNAFSANQREVNNNSFTEHLIVLQPAAFGAFGCSCKAVNSIDLYLLSGRLS